MPRDVDRVREWLGKANTDLKSAQRLLAGDDPITETACFHCQQCVEKSLKGFLQWQAIEPPHIHLLIPLFVQCKPHSTDIYELRHECAWLTAFAVAARYPSAAGPPTVERAHEAYVAAERLLHAVLRELPPEVHP